MSEADWHDGALRFIGLLFGAEGPEPNEPLFLMYLNASDRALPVALPAHVSGWELLLDTGGNPRSNVAAPLALAAESIELEAFSTALLRSRTR